MQALIQRVSEARVTVDGRVTGAIGPGLLVLLCAERGDDRAVADRLAPKGERLEPRGKPICARSTTSTPTKLVCPKS